MTTLIPQEIIDHIISELHSEFKTLYECSLTGWQLLVPARRLIFHSICITQDPKEEFGKSGRDHARLLRLVQILENDPSCLPSRQEFPTLSSCVRHLHLRLASPRSGRFGYKPSQIMSAQAQWNAMNAPLPDVFAQLNHIEKFSIHFLAPGRCVWRLLEPSISISFLAFLRSPSIKTLDLSRISGLPAAAVLHCPNLNDLTMEYMFDEDPEISADTALTMQSPGPAMSFEPSCPPPFLESLSVKGSDSFCAVLANDPAKAVILHHVRSLIFNYTSPHPFDIQWRISEAAASTLQVLRLSSNLDHNPNGAQLLLFKSAAMYF